MTHFRHQTRSDIRHFVVERFPDARGTAITDEDPLLSSGVIDSLGVLDLVTFIEAEYGMRLDDGDLTPENFDSIAAIARLVERKHS